MIAAGCRSPPKKLHLKSIALKFVFELPPPPAGEAGGGADARLLHCFCSLNARGYPHSPQPKLAVKRMQKATIPIIQRSSGFIVGFLLSGKGISSRQFRLP
jgi:hypothetical protein